MPTNIPSNLYSGEAERFSSNSNSASMAMQLIARKQAREEALDNYEIERLNRINTNGVRDVDREGFDKKILSLMDFYSKNKDYIRKKTTSEAFNYEKMFRNIIGDINNSKDRTARYEAASKLREQYKKNNQILPSSFSDAIIANEYSIYDDKNHKPLDVNYWATIPNNFDQKKYLERYKDITPVETELVSNKPISDDNYNLLRTMKKVLTDEQKNVIKARAIADYHELDDFNNKVNTDMIDPQRKSELISVYQQNFGESPKDAEDYAAAVVMELKQPEMLESKVVPNMSYIQSERDKKWYNHAAKAQKYAMQRMAESRASRENNGGDRVGYITDEYAVKKGKSFLPEFNNFFGEPIKNILIDEGLWDGKNEITIVEKNDIDNDHKEIFAGNLNPFNFNGKDVYIVDDDGNIRGMDVNGKIGIRYRSAAKEAWVSKNGNTKIKIGVSDKGNLKENNVQKEQVEVKEKINKISPQQSKKPTKGKLY